MPNWFDDPQQRAHAAADPLCAPDTLRFLAASWPELRPVIAANPAGYPELLAWLAALGDPAVDSVLALRAVAQRAGQPRRGLRPWAWWLIGVSAVLVVAVGLSGVGIAASIPFVSRSVSRSVESADSPFVGTPGSALLTEPEVRDATRGSDGIFDGDPERYTLAEYIDMYSDGGAEGGEVDGALFSSDSAPDPAPSQSPDPDPDPDPDDEKTAPAGCWDEVTGFLSLPKLDTPSYAGYKTDRIWSIEDDSDGGLEQLRQFVDASSATQFLGAEKDWYARCSRIDEYTTSPDDWDTRDTYSPLHLDGLPSGVSAIAFTDETQYSVEVYLQHGDEVEALDFFPSDVSTASSTASPITAAVIAAAAKKLTGGL